MDLASSEACANPAVCSAVCGRSTRRSSRASSTAPQPGNIASTPRASRTSGFRGGEMTAADGPVGGSEAPCPPWASSWAASVGLAGTGLGRRTRSTPATTSIPGRDSLPMLTGRFPLRRGGVVARRLARIATVERPRPERSSRTATTTRTIALKCLRKEALRATCRGRVGPRQRRYLRGERSSKRDRSMYMVRKMLCKHGAGSPPPRPRLLI